MAETFLIAEEKEDVHTCDSPAFSAADDDQVMVPGSDAPASCRRLHRSLSVHEDFQTSTSAAAVQQASAMVSPQETPAVALYRERVRANIESMRHRLTPEAFHQLQHTMEAELPAQIAQAAIESMRHRHTPEAFRQLQHTMEAELSAEIAQIMEDYISTLRSCSRQL